MQEKILISPILLHIPGLVNEVCRTYLKRGRSISIQGLHGAAYSRGVWSKKILSRRVYLSECRMSGSLYGTLDEDNCPIGERSGRSHVQDRPEHSSREDLSPHETRL